MAPSPEYDKEPKAPDKSASHISSEDAKLLHNLVNDQHGSSDHKTTNLATNSEVENKHVETLDDEKLRALLDEAITYKCPKDREGKSSLFKELLEEVEQDEQACEAAARNLTGCRGSRRGARGRRPLPHSNSLQDLVAALAAEPTPRHPRHHARHHAPAPSNVSARAIHGGSLPSGVDTSSLLSEEGVGVGVGVGVGAGAGGYLATVRCVNPPPLAERRVSASDANAPHELELLNRRSKPMFPMTYTARATLEIGSGSVGSGRAVTTTTASNQVDSAIPFSCITTPEVVTSCNTTSSSSTIFAIDPEPPQLMSSYGAVSSLTSSPAGEPASHPVHDAPDLQPRSVIASSFNGLPLSRPNYGSTATSNDEYKRSVDENGNAVQGASSPVSGSSLPKKPRRKKSSRNETDIDYRQIDGYRGDKADLNELLRFIESNKESRGPKVRAKHKDDADDKSTKKRSAERRKDKEKVKRASSLEELSRTKLEDLTARAAPAPKPERRSWGDATPTPIPVSISTPTPIPVSIPTATPIPAPEPEPEPKQPPTPPEPETYDPIEPAASELPVPLPDPTVEQADFQTVTKKRKPRRRTEEAARRARAPSPRRQGSAPASASDRSNDSNDDMDSVHSLPQPGGRGSLASYADIARTRHNIPDLIESCNYYVEGEGGPVSAVEADYPALETRLPEVPQPRRRDAKHPPPPRRDRKERERERTVLPATTAAAECPAPDVVADRRPPVILVDSDSRPRDMDGVTFGFDINEQLLGGSRRVRCDLVCDTVALAAETAVSVRAACRALRYLPPDAPPPRQLHQIVEYVATAWDDVIRCGGGKVPYYSE